MTVGSIPIPEAPAFRQRCRCRTQPLTVRVTPPGGEPRSEHLCSVCVAQLEALGYTVGPR